LVENKKYKDANPKINKNINEDNKDNKKARNININENKSYQDTNTNKKDAKVQVQKNKKREQKPNNLLKLIGVLAFIIIIVAVIFGAYEFYSTPQQSASFSTFESNFNSAPNVAIVVSADNGTALSYAINCEISLIETITSSHINHKAPSAMSIYIMNKTSCTYLNGLGVASGNYLTATPSECINMTKGIPSIFINYSNTNSTIITPYSIYFSGNAKFLQTCGIAPELASGS